MFLQSLSSYPFRSVLVYKPVEYFCYIFLLHLCNAFCSASLTPWISVIRRVRSIVMLLRFLSNFQKKRKKPSFACGYPFFRLHRHSHFVTCTTLLYAPFFWTLSQNTDFSAVMSTCLLRYLLFVIAWVFCSTISICVWIAVLTHAWRTSKGSVVSG